MTPRIDPFGTAAETEKTAHALEDNEVYQLMVRHIAAGRQVILCGRDHIRPGTVLRIPQGFNIRVKRLATRQEFIDQGPEELNRKIAEMIPRKPHYYEIEPTTAPISDQTAKAAIMRETSRRLVTIGDIPEKK